MDLLGGYGSDDSESSVEGAREQQQQTANPLPPTVLASAPAAAARVPPPPRSNRRGKRIVSLHAVLPTHILNQLEKSTATGSLDDSDDDDEDEVPTGVAASAAPTQDSKRHAVVGKDEGLSSFLTELKSAPTTTFVGGSVSGGSVGDEKPTTSQPLGQAFMNKTVVVSSSGDGSNEVLDVHASDKADLDTKVTARRAVAIPSAPRPSQSVVVSVPRPSVNVRPIVASTMAPQPPARAPMPMEQQAPYYHNDVANMQDEPKVDDRRAKKRSRKEMEKALRSGNLDALEESDVTTLDAQGTVYVPQEETYAVPAAGAVKVAPVRMYDPKAGSDVVQANVTGKQRGKHQINQLLASAANLELQRARSMNTGVKSKRADAKRKYGW